MKRLMWAYLVTLVYLVMAVTAIGLLLMCGVR